MPDSDSPSSAGSWDLRARYTVRNPATLRQGKLEGSIRALYLPILQCAKGTEISSDWVGELKVGGEVPRLSSSCKPDGVVLCAPGSAP